MLYRRFVWREFASETALVDDPQHFQRPNNKMQKAGGQYRLCFPSFNMIAIVLSDHNDWKAKPCSNFVQIVNIHSKNLFAI